MIDRKTKNWIDEKVKEAHEDSKYGEWVKVPYVDKEVFVSKEVMEFYKNEINKPEYRRFLESDRANELED